MSVAVFVRHFSGKSRLFEEKTRDREEYQGLDEAQWHRSALKAVKRAHKVFLSLLQGTLAYSSLKSMVQSLDPAELDKELEIISSFPPYQQQGLGTQEGLDTIRKAVFIMNYIEAGYIRAVVMTVREHDLVPEADEDLRYLSDLDSEQERIEGNTKLRRLTQQYDKLYSLLKPLSAEHLRLFMELSRGCHQIMTFFATQDYHSDSGQQQFQTKLDNLNMRMQRDPFSNQVLMCLLDAHTSLAPFFLCKHKCAMGEATSIQYLLQSVKNTRVNPDGVVSANGHALYIEELFRRATASATENTVHQLGCLSEGGELVVQLKNMLCQPSTYAFTYRLSSSGSDAGSDVQQSELSMEEVAEFRSNLQYLRSLQQNDDDFHDSQRVAQQANDFAVLLDHVENLVALLMELERDGHPNYQSQSLAYKLEQDEIERALQTLTGVKKEWEQLLAKSRQQCPILLLFSNQDIANMLMLMSSARVQLPCTQLSDRPFWTQQAIAVAKLTNLARLPGHPTAELEKAAALLNNYLLSVCSVARLKEGVDVQEAVRMTLRANQTRHEQLLDNLLKLVAVVFTDLQCGSSSLASKQFVCCPQETNNDMTSALVFLATLFLCKHKSLPCHAQILFCSERTSADELNAFFQRITHLPLPRVRNGRRGAPGLQTAHACLGEAGTFPRPSRQPCHRVLRVSGLCHCCIMATWPRFTLSTPPSPPASAEEGTGGVLEQDSSNKTTKSRCCGW